MRFLPDSQFTEALHRVASSLETRNVSMHSQEECVVFMRGGPRRFATAATDDGRRMADDDVVNGKLGPIVYFAAGLRSFVIGFTGVALGLYLAALGYDPALVGGVVASGLAGNAFGLALVDAYRATLGAAALLSLVSVLLYTRLPAALARAPAASHPGRLSPESRRRVAGLSALFALDSLGGGFIAGSILSYWFFRRFGLGGEALGPVFFAAKCLNAGSYFRADALARRLGLVRTMVFTHLPTSVILLALPFLPTAVLAIALFPVREAFVQMDVPAAQSYVASVTAPGERTAALALTSLVRNVGWAAGPALAGVTMTAFGLGAPLVAGAVVKAVYDVALYVSHRGIRPPEERS